MRLVDDRLFLFIEHEELELPPVEEALDLDEDQESGPLDLSSAVSGFPPIMDEPFDTYDRRDAPRVDEDLPERRPHHPATWDFT